jgi:DNA-binding transcriptional ArsR family regulator
MFDLYTHMLNVRLAALAEQVKRAIESASAVQIIEEKCYVYDFRKLCEQSGLDPGGVVRGLLRLKEVGVIDAFNLDDNEHYLMVRMVQNGPY